MPGTTAVANSGNHDIDGLLYNRKWAVSSFTFSFPTSTAFYEAGAAPNGELTNNFGALNSTQQDYVRNFALKQFAAVTNLSFAEMAETASNHADMRFAKTDATSTAWGYYPAAQPYGGDTWYRNSGGSYDNPVIGNYAAHTFMHEIGHALGLAHGHDTTNPFGALPTGHDSIEYSIMTYRSYVGGPSSGGYTYGSASAPQTLMQNDIAALQYLYGANYSTNSGNTVYSWSPSTGQTFVNGVSMGPVAGNKIFLTVWDGNGVDTYNLSAYSTNLSINLQPGGWSTFDTANTAQRATLGAGNLAAGNVANALLYNGNTQSLIENVIGGSGNDSIIGNVASNDLSGGGGNDILNGLAGADVLTGGAGADTFRFDSTALGSQDQITDYSFAANDILDLSALVTANSANLSSYVSIVESSPGNTFLRVDLDGSGSTYGWNTIAQVAGVGGSARVQVGGLGTTNVTVGTLSSVDLVIDSISAPLTVMQGATLNFSYVVKNAGNLGTTSLHWSGIMVDQPVSETQYQAYDTINSLAAGASITFNNSISTAGLSIGQHTLYIKEDYWYNLVVEGNENNNVLSVTFNVVASGVPAPTITSFSNDSGTVGDRITNDNTLALAGSAPASSTVNVYAGATLLGTATANGSGSWSFATGVLADGTHSLTATATVGADTSAPSAPFSVTIDTVAPGQAMVLNYSNDSGVAGDGITNDNTISLVGNAPHGTTVRVYDGATLLGSTTASPTTGAFNFTTGVLPDGAHSFSALAVDAAGNVSAPFAIPVNVTIDTVAPGAPTITSFSDDSGTVGDGITNDNTLTFTGNAVANTTVRVYDGTTLLGSTTATGGGAWSFTTAALPDGGHSFTARAADTAGNLSPASAPLGVTIVTATSPADLVVDSISAPSSVVQGATLNFSYVLKNYGGAQAGMHWSGFTIDQQVTETNYQGYDTISSLAAGASVTFNNSINTAGLSVGQHTLYIEEDYWYNTIAESNENNNVRSITFDVTSAPGTPADLVVSSISAPLSVAQGATLNFSYVLKNYGGTQAGIHWSGFAIDQQVTETNYQGYDTINSLAAGASATFNNSISTAGLSVGQHTLYIEEDYWYNTIGESNENNNVRTITFNVTAPGGNDNVADDGAYAAHDLPAWVGAIDEDDLATSEGDLLTWTGSMSVEAGHHGSHGPLDVPAWISAIDESDLVAPDRLSQGLLNHPATDGDGTGDRVVAHELPNWDGAHNDSDGSLGIARWPMARDWGM